ncbi:AEC family transporter [Jiangella ureilytica]|uniref:AEC family transporter n=1 Tax=Jiangella ureilytica TaxID=2530374 RepID=A0A4R4R9P9_9ACTN|nr:AEC family transporter [Jiangella ureilytica]TDC45677.1 AEC family transporter [Jiangella ureilytica]
MTSVVTGFAVIVVIIGVGYVLGRTELLGPAGPMVLTRLAFWVASPALMFHTVAEADLGVIVAEPLIATGGSVVIVAAVFALAGLWRRWSVSYSTLGVLCSCLVNAGNLGIPIAAYVLGDATLVAPILLMQTVVIVPVALTVLDLAGQGSSTPVWRRFLTPLQSPITVASLAGVVVAATGVTVPGPIMEPFILVGAISIPSVLMVFGISLRGSTWPGRGPDRRPLALAVVLKTLVHPAVAYLLGLALGLSARELLAVVVLSALPTAQNALTFAMRYGQAQTLVREAVLVTTVLSLPVLVLVTALLR